MQKLQLEKMGESLAPTPRPYLSWSQYNLFNRSPAEYKKRYITDPEKKFENKYTRFGKEVARMREKGDKFEGLEHIRTFLPDYPNKEYTMTALVTIDKKKVELLGKFDGCDLRKHIVADDKTGLHWSQAKADKTEQLTFYAFIYWKKKGINPKLYIHWIQTEVEDSGDIVATGKVETFSTTRTIKDFLVLQAKINKVWRGIVRMTDEEWSKVI